MPKFNDITGMRFGRMTAVECTRRGSRSGGVSLWLCQCDCGKTKVTQSAHLVNGATQSCGCLQKETARLANTKHGMKNTRIYDIFENMFERCCNPNQPAYKNYGGRGICICPEWLADRTTFFKWAAENGYADDLSIDRIDNDKGYSPENCRWATGEQQNQNRRSNVMLTIDGVTKVISAWAKDTGISRKTISARLKNGWSHADAVMVPAGGRT